ncbi:MAG: sulfur carrier protein ThiS [Gammaproteobacteria bacterium]
MQIVVNGQPRDAAERLALPHLIEQLQLGDRRVAIELNGAIVPRSAWPATRLADGDRLEIVQAIGGG